MKLILGCIVETIGTRVDGSIKMSLGSQEIDPTQAGTLFQLRGKFVKVLLSDTNISPIEEKLVDEERVSNGKKVKSPSQRLKAVMFKVHENQGIQQDFDEWYKGEIENFINKYKEVLNNEA